MSSRGSRVNYNKENNGGPLNLLRKVQRTRKEQIEKKMTSRGVCEINGLLKENRNNANKLVNQKYKRAEILKPLKDKAKIPLEPLFQEEKVLKDVVEDFRTTETRKTMKTYSHDMLADMKLKQSQYQSGDCLRKHGISSSVRAKMVRKIY